MKSIFFIGFFTCLCFHVFSKNSHVDLWQEKETLEKIEASLQSSLFKDISVSDHHRVVGSNKDFSARTGRRSIVNAHRMALMSHKSVSVNVAKTVHVEKKAPVSIEYHECAIKLNDCSRILHLFYLY